MKYWVGKKVKVSLNPLAFVGVTKSEFKSQFADKLGGEFENAWKFVRENRPRKSKED